METPQPEGTCTYTYDALNCAVGVKFRDVSNATILVGIGEPRSVAVLYNDQPWPDPGLRTLGRRTANRQAAVNCKSQVIPKLRRRFRSLWKGIVILNQTLP